MGKLIDIYGNEYVIQDIISFKEHIIKYHTLDGSLMEVYMKKMVTILE